MKAAIYCRVSSDDQRERETIKTQRESCLRFCETNNIPVYKIYEDDGVTGTIALEQRPMGKQLLEDARKSLFSVVVVYNVKRLGRDARHILNAVYDFEDAKLEVRSATEQFDISTSSGRFYLTILAGSAGFDRDTFVELSIELSRMVIE
jgi:site-specific DNA recombinase